MGTRTVSNTINLQNPGEQVSKYITDITSEGIYVHSSDTPSDPSASTAKGIKIANRIDMIRNGISVASYGELVTIGKESETRAEIDYHSLQLIDKESQTYLYISDLRQWETINNDKVFVATLVETFTGDGETRAFDVNFSVDYEISAIDNSDSSNTATRQDKTYTFNHAPEKWAKVQITYKTLSNDAKAYTLGFAEPESTIGALSIREGWYTIASGAYAHAEGSSTKATGIAAHVEGAFSQSNGDYSHAEGFRARANGSTSHAEGNDSQASGESAHAEGKQSQAIGSCSHAEGYSTTAQEYAHVEGYQSQANGDYSHAESYKTKANGDVSHAEGGETVANGDYSHAEGFSTTATGNFSHTSGYRTIAGSNYQTVIGKNNITDSNDTYSFVIGNGSSNNYRSNAFSVTWDGNIHMHINTSIETDEDLIDSITNLGWTDAIIE